MTDVAEGKPREHERLLRRLNVLHHSAKIRNALIKILTTGAEEVQLHSVIQYLAYLAASDAGYFLVVSEEKVLAVAFYSGDPDLVFPIGDGQFSVEVPPAPVMIDGPHTSYLGKLEFVSSVVLPIKRKEKLVGLVQLGCFGGEIQKGRAQLLFQIHRDLVSVFSILQEHIVKTQQFRTLTTRLNETESAFNMLMNDSQDLILTIDPECTIQTINRVGKELLGIDADGPPGKLNLESPGMALILRLLGVRRSLSDMEIIIKTRKGEAMFCLASFSAEFDDKNNIERIHGVLKDISERVEAQRQLWEANIELNEANDQLKQNEFQMVQSEKLASIGYLAAGIAHEINNPLGFIQSNYDTLRRYIERISAYIGVLEKRIPESESIRAEHKMQRVMDDLPSLISDTDEGFARISRIVNSLKNFSHIDSEGAVTMLDISKAIDDTLTVATNSWKYVAKIETRYELNTPVECLGDQINQVFLNLIVNAAQAIESQHRSEPGNIRIHTWGQGETAYIRIEDDGPGIPAGIREKVFTPFFTTKPIGEGTGLGLSISFDIIVKKHRGKLVIEDGPGTAFVIQIPLLFSEGAREVLSVGI